MPALNGEAYATVAHMWRTLYDEPPPAQHDADALLGRLIGAMEPLAYDQFYQPFLSPDSAEGLAKLTDATDRPIPSPARIRALDMALRSMLRSCPVPEGLRTQVERLGASAAVTAEPQRDRIPA